MLKLKYKKIQPAMLGLPASPNEWWDLGGGYEIYLYIECDPNHCGLVVKAPTNNITLEVSRYLGINTKTKDIKFNEKSHGRELYLSSGIDCVILNYTKPEKYRDLLKKIAVIVDKHFKNES